MWRKIPILLVVLLASIYIQPVLPQPQVWSQGQWILVKTDEITVMFPAGGEKPVFVWWRTGDNSTIYVVHFKGMWEYFILNISEPRVFRHRYRFEYRLVNDTFVKPVLEKIVNKTQALKTVKKHVEKYIQELNEVEANITKLVLKIREINSRFAEYNNTVSSIIEESCKLNKTIEHICRYIENCRNNMSTLESHASMKHVNIGGYITSINSYLNEISEIIEDLVKFTEDFKNKKMSKAFSELPSIESKTTVLISKSHGLKETTRNLHEMIHVSHGDLEIYSQQLLSSVTEIETLAANISASLNKIKELREALLAVNATIDLKSKEIKESLKNMLKVEESLGTEVSLELSKYMNQLEVKNELELAIEIRLKLKAALSELNETINIRLHECCELKEEDVNKCLINITKSKNLLNSVIVNVSKCISEKEEELKVAQELCKEINAKWRSPFLPFDSCSWKLTNIEEIKAGNKTIGVAFTYILEKVHIPSYEFAENNIMLRCRLYTVTVEEQSGELNYTVQRAELKVDFIVKKWVWLSDLLVGNFSKLFNVTISADNEGLALWITAASVNYTIAAKKGLSIIEAALANETDLLASSAVVVSQKGVSTKLSIKKYDNETQVLTVPRVPNLIVKVNLASEDKVLGGFLKFIATAKVIYLNGTTEVVPVSASYMSAGGFFMLFLCYPYFNNGSLEHDPSVGVITTEEAPAYRVVVSETTLKVQQVAEQKAAQKEETSGTQQTAKTGETSKATEEKTAEKTITTFGKSTRVMILIVLIATIVALLTLLLFKKQRAINEI